MERIEGIRDEHMAQKLASWQPAFQHALVGSEPSGCGRKQSQREDNEHENQN
jgi:hypothetical protein